MKSRSFFKHHRHNNLIMKRHESTTSRNLQKHTLTKLPHKRNTSSLSIVMLSSNQDSGSHSSSNNPDEHRRGMRTRSLTSSAEREVSTTGIHCAKSDKCIDIETLIQAAPTHTSAESLAIALESAIRYTLLLLSEIAPAEVRPYAAANVAALSRGEFHCVVLPNLQDVFNNLTRRKM